MGFRSEDMLEGRPIDQLSADEVYVLAKSLPNFTVAKKREAYRAILAEALETATPNPPRASRYSPTCARNFPEGVWRRSRRHTVSRATRSCRNS